MANNPYVNKVIYGNQTIMDISDTDATESDVVSGKTFYKGSGERSTGSAVIPDISNCYQTTDTAETDLADADCIPFYDSSAIEKRKTLWSNIKAKLKTYFDGIYGLKVSESLLRDTVGWTGKNLMSAKLSDIKAINTTGTWSGNVYTRNGIAYTINTDADGYVTEINVNGTASDDSELRVWQNFSLENGKEYILSGCNGGGLSTYKLLISQNYSSASHITICLDGDELFMFNSASANSNKMAISVSSGQVLSNVKFYPMLRKASIADGTFEPYHKSVEQVLETKGDWDARNLITMPYCTTGHGTYGVTFTPQKDGTIIINGTTTQASYFVMHKRSGLDDEHPMILPAGDYIVSKEDTNVSLEIAKTSNGSKVVIADVSTSSKSATFTLTEDTQIGCSVGVPNGKTLSNFVFKPMIQLASNDNKDYAPHREPLTEAVDSKMSYADNGVLGAKNLFPLSFKYLKSINTLGTWVDNVYTWNGVSYDCTVNDAGDVIEIDVDGTTSAFSYFTFEVITKKSYLAKYTTDMIFNGCPSNGSDNSFRLAIQFNDTASETGIITYKDYGSGVFVPKSSISKAYFKSSISINQNVTMSHKKFYPMLRLASDSDSIFQPYAMTNKELTDVARREHSYIGMIIHSTTLDTMAKVIAQYGGTTWIQHSGYMLRGATSGVVANSAVKTGGADTHTLTVNEMPSHNHTDNCYRFTTDGSFYGLHSGSVGFQNTQLSVNTGNAGGGQAHNNLPQYKSVYIWERTA